MSYLPAFIRLEDKKVLIVGGGVVSLRKLKYLLDFTSDIYVISKDFSKDMLIVLEENFIKYDCCEYKSGLIKEFDIVVVSIDDKDVQKEIYLESKDCKCLCNFVDFLEYCDFIFPSYIQKGDLTIAISTSGSSPSFTRYLKKYLLDIIPDNISDFLCEMKSLRKTLPKGQKRMEFFDKKTKKYMLDWFKPI